MARGLVGLGAVGLLGFFAPVLAAPFVRSLIEREIEAAVHGDAEVAEVELAWSGAASVRGVALSDGTGDPVASVRRVDLQVDLRRALRGDYRFSVVVEGAELRAAQDEEGSWNLVELLREDRDEHEREPRDPEDEPAVAGTVELREGRVAVETPHGDLELADVSLRVEIESLLSPARVELDLGLRGEATEGEGGRVRASGTITPPRTGSGEEELPSGELTLELNGIALETLAPLLPPLHVQGEDAGSPGSPGSLRGELEALVRADLGARASIELEAQARDLDLVLPRPEGEPLAISEPSVGLEAALTFDPGPSSLELSRLALSSRLVRGEMSGRVEPASALLDEDPSTRATFAGWQGTLHYVPSELAGVLGTPLPFDVEVLGAEEEQLEFALDGEMGSLETAALLEGATVRASAGLGPLAAPGLDARGGVEVELSPERLELVANLEANGGTLGVRAATSPATSPEAEAATTLTLEAKGVEANARLAWLLSFLHPAFAAVEALEKSELSGALDASLDLSLEGLGRSELLDGRLDLARPELLSGSGNFVASSFLVAGTPIVEHMVALLGVEPRRPLELRPLAFAIESGRLTYDRPWTWTLGGIETRFEGSLGLDRTLDLHWMVPVTPELVRRSSLLAPLQGRELDLPIGGTVSRPRVDFEATLSTLLKDAAAQEVRDHLEQEIRDRLGLGDLPIPGLPGVLGIPGAGSGSRDTKDDAREDPSELLRRADELWDAGKKVDAAELYRRIREEHKLSVVYALNRDKIKERGRYTE